ncbi:MAG TPA: hypothetical protein VHL14_08570 [Steroidobacteraceae bacterium]|nr:hypothetical protein [Steroidobacteraceae bacterium]
MMKSLVLVVALCSSPSLFAQEISNCAADNDLHARLKSIMAIHPGGKLNTSFNAITWISPTAIASSIEYVACSDAAVTLTKHVKMGHLTVEKVFSTALAMSNTFLDDATAALLQKAVFRNQLQHRADDGSSIYELIDKAGYSVFRIEYNPLLRFVRLSVLK